MRKTKVELEQELEQVRNENSSLKDKLSRAEDRVRRLIKERDEARHEVHSRGLLIKYLTETFFTWDYPEEGGPE